MNEKYFELIKELKEYTYWFGGSLPCSREIHPPICDRAAEAIAELLKISERNEV